MPPRGEDAYPYGVLRPTSKISAFVAIAVVFGGCLSGGPPLLPPEEETPADPIDLGDAGSDRRDVDLGDPFALEGLSPSHGPFTGGVRATLSGRGFSSKLRVFLGDAEVAPGSLLASDPSHVAVVTPPGPPGFVDVKIRDDETARERILPNGYHYDAIVVSPSSGATSGGTRITLTGSQTSWTSASRVDVDGVACTNVEIAGPTSIACVTPPGSPGLKTVTVTTGSVKDEAREAYTYSDTEDGYRGGLSGGALAGRVRVVAFDAFTGTPIAGAFAIAGGTLETAVVQKTNDAGVTEIDGLTASKVTVTVAAKCHQPTTFVDVPVDSVTAYLQPVLDLSCAEGDPPSTGGGGGRYGGVVEGELVFPVGGEFSIGWTSVPLPKTPTERRAAYVFQAAGSARGEFRLPPAAAAITPEQVGTHGYPYSLVVYPGNVTFYVVAGIEDRSVTPERFVPYAMGVARGVTVPPRTRVSGVDVAMNVLFDHRVDVAPLAPSPGPRGPDRLSLSLAVTLGAAGYAIVPRGSLTAPLPAPSTMSFVGVPSLDKALTGESYVLGAAAVTGAGQEPPASVVSLLQTTNANDAVTLGGFLGVPTLEEPGTGTWSGRRVRFSGMSGPVDLSVTTVSSRAGLVTWTIVAPAGVTSFDLPDLDALPGPDAVGLGHGAVRTTVYFARIDDFEYGKLRTGQLSTGAFGAYALDTANGTY